MVRIDMDAYHRSLAETVAWVVPRCSEPNPGVALWSPDLWVPDSPRPKADTAHRSEIDGEIDLILPEQFGEDGYEAACRLVVGRRREAVHASGLTAAAPDGDLHGGRMVVCYTLNTFWGCLGEASHGLVTAGGIPAWDTWVHMVPDKGGGHGHLLAWIPEAYVALVQAAMDTDPEMTFVWAAPQDDPQRALRESWPWQRKGQR